MYPPLESVGNSAANENSPFQIGLGSREFLGLYKPAVPDQQHDTWAYSSVANSSELGPPSPPGPLRRTARTPGPGQGLSTPFSRTADALTCVSRWKPPCPSQQPFYALIFVSQRVLRSRVRPPQAFHTPTAGDLVANGDATALQRYSAQPNGHLHGGIGVTKYKLKVTKSYKQK